MSNSISYYSTLVLEGFFQLLTDYGLQMTFTNTLKYLIAVARLEQLPFHFRRGASISPDSHIDSSIFFSSGCSTNNLFKEESPEQALTLILAGFFPLACFLSLLEATLNIFWYILTRFLVSEDPSMMKYQIIKRSYVISTFIPLYYISSNGKIHEQVPCRYTRLWLRDTIYVCFLKPWKRAWLWLKDTVFCQLLILCYMEYIEVQCIIQQRYYINDIIIFIY